jgi:hypothetical protein
MFVFNLILTLLFTFLLLKGCSDNGATAESISTTSLCTK